MGLAASQARLLTLTARLADNELRSQTINNAKMRLATQSSQASDEYVTALNKAQLQFSNTDITGASQSQLLTFNALTSYSPYNTQYGLVNSSGLLLVSEADAANFEAANGNLNNFLAKYGIGWNTSYFDDGIQIGANLASVYGDKQYLQDYLKSLDNNTLKEMYENYDANCYSIEMANYNKYASEYANELSTLNDKYINVWFGNLFGTTMSGDPVSISDVVEQYMHINSETRPRFLAYFLRNSAAKETGRDALSFMLNSYYNRGNVPAVKNYTVIGDKNYVGYTPYFTDLTKDCAFSAEEEWTGQTKIYVNLGENGEQKQYVQQQEIPEKYYVDLGSGNQEIDASQVTTNEDGTYSYVFTDEEGNSTPVPVEKVPAHTEYSYTDAEGNVNVVNNEDVKEEKVMKSVLSLDVGSLTINFDVPNNMANYFTSQGKVYNDGENSYEIYTDDGGSYYYKSTSKKIYPKADDYIPTSVEIQKDDKGKEFYWGVEIEKVYIDETAEAAKISDNGQYKIANTNMFASLTISSVEGLDDEEQVKALKEQGMKYLNNIYIKNGEDSTSYTGFRYIDGKLSQVALYQDNIDTERQFLTDFFTFFKSDSFFDITNYLNSNDLSDDEKQELQTARDNFLGLIFESGQIPNIDISALKAEDYMDIENFLQATININGEQKTLASILEQDKQKKEGKVLTANFWSILDARITQLMIEEFGEPKYTWGDSTDVSNTGNAEIKAQWYTNLFNRMLKGYKTLENGLASSNEWVEYALENGTITMEQVDSSYNWNALDYKSCSSIIEDTANTVEIAKAEAKYKRAMNDIEAKDSVYDIQLKNLDTEHTTIQTEYDVVKGVISKNIERTMKFNQSA